MKASPPPEGGQLTSIKALYKYKALNNVGRLVIISARPPSNPRLTSPRLVSILPLGGKMRVLQCRLRGSIQILERPKNRCR